MIKNKIPVLSFFTGGGFLDIGFELTGFNIIWTNEFNAQFADIYDSAYSKWRKSRNMSGEIKISNRKSITSIKAKDILAEAFAEGRPQYFGVIGGPPCIDFSRGGKKRGFSGKHGNLTRVFLNKVISLSPSFFVMENVPYLETLHKERKVLEKLLDKVSRKGSYLISHKVLNSLELGAPQDRERLFIIGIKKKFLNAGLLDKFQWPSNEKYTNARKLNWPKTNKFGTTPVLPKDIPYELTVHNAFTKKGGAENLPNGKEWFNPISEKFWSRPEGGMVGMSFKRLHRYRFSPTAWYGNNEVHLHPWKARRISVREALRLQTVPDSYVLPQESTLTAKFKMICNGVPCLMGERVAQSVMEFIKNNTKITFC